MTIEQTVISLINSLKNEGSAPNNAPWGVRVSLFTSSETVELSGNPKEKTWPCLMLFGPEIIENTQRRQHKTKEVVTEDPDAYTAETRPWPRFYNLTFSVVFETRVGFQTTAITATQQLLQACEQFNQWIERTTNILGCDLYAEAMSPGLRPRITPADIRSATATITILDVPVYSGGLTTVHTVKESIVDALPVAELPQD